MSSSLVLTFSGIVSGDTITLPITGSGTLAVTVNWGDGTTTTDSTLTHEYAANFNGNVTITVTDGTVSGFGSSNSWSGGDKLTTVTPINDTISLNWGLPGITSLFGAFGQTSSLTSVPDYIPSSVSNLANMFQNSNFNQGNINNWDISNVNFLGAMFENATLFNQDLNSWDTSGVTGTRNMFFNAAAFNGNISSWNVSNVTNMEGMFRFAIAFNQYIGGWDVSNINNSTMNQMFDGCIVFNQNLSSWNVSNVTRMFSMFNNCNNFNQDISGWDVSKVDDMRYMFQNAEDFFQNIYVWKPDDGILFLDMFSGATTMLDKFSGFPGMGTTPTKGSEASPGFFYLVDSPYLSLITGNISVALYNPTNDDPYVQGLTTEELRQSLS